jgi:hypothetical protein
MHRTPEEAALESFPTEHCRVVAGAREGDDAYVLLDTGTRERPYLYGVAARRDAAGWHDGSSGNGCGGTLTDADGHLGVLSLWDDAPAGADAVRVRWSGSEREVDVREGAFLAAWFRVPCPESAGPEVIAFRIGGRWVAPPA